MKNQNLFSKMFVTVSLCVCGLFISAGFFAFSIKTANAKQNEFNQMLPTGIVGKYMMQYVTWMPEANIIVRQILVWDTETGKSKRYTLNDNSEWVPADTQLPEKPLQFC